MILPTTGPGPIKWGCPEGSWKQSLNRELEKNDPQEAGGGRKGKCTKTQRRERIHRHVGNYTYVTRVSTGQERERRGCKARRGWERATGPS